MAQAPKLILNSDGMPWGRWVQQNVQSHATDIASIKKTSASQAAVQNAQLKQMAGQIQTLAAQQATLASQQATLATQEIQIENALAHIVAPASIHATSSNYGLSTSFTTVCSDTYTVPSGFTTALIITMLSVNFANPNPSNPQYGTARISYAASGGGSSGASGNYDVALAGGGVGSTTVSLPQNWTSLTAGQTITFNAQVLCGVSGSANSFNLASLGGIGIFLA